MSDFNKLFNLLDFVNVNIQWKKNTYVMRICVIQFLNVALQQFNYNLVFKFTEKLMQ